jgi:hypothetical protein
MTPNRTEREERIAQDGGDGDDMVWVIHNQYTKGYHDESDCPYLRADDERISRWRRAKAQRHKRFPCKRCVLGGKDGGATGPSLAPLLRDPDVELKTVSEGSGDE